MGTLVACEYIKEEALLSITGVSLTLGGRQILRDVHAQICDITRPGVAQGQVVCFLGPSGIGKTRLSRIIAGLDQPTTGSVTLKNGKPVTRGLVGMVAQNYPLFEFATVAENFEIAASQGLNASPRRASWAQNEYVAAFELEPFLSHYPAQLSGGTRQRAAIVRQLLCSEHFLVLDEPFSGLDLIMKRRACAVIQKVAALDTLNTIIIVTHDVTEGMSVADMVWLMGCERGPDGKAIPGARIIQEYDLAAAGLAWHPDLPREPEFMTAVDAVKAKFLSLEG